MTNLATKLITDEIIESKNDTQSMDMLINLYFETKRNAEIADNQKKQAQNAIAELLGFKYGKELTEKQAESFKGAEIDKENYSVTVFSKGFSSLDKEKLFKIITEKQYEKCQNTSVKVQMRITKK
jgi:hypothetical protein